MLLVVVISLLAAEPAVALDSQYLTSSISTALSSCVIKASATDPTGSKFFVVADCAGNITLPSPCGSIQNAGGTDVVVVAFSSADLSCVWANRIFSPQSDTATDISIDSQGQYLVVSGYWVAVGGNPALRVQNGDAPGNANLNATEGFLVLMRTGYNGAYVKLARVMGSTLSSQTMVHGVKFQPSSTDLVYTGSFLFVAYSSLPSTH